MIGEASQLPILLQTDSLQAPLPPPFRTQCKSPFSFSILTDRGDGKYSASCFAMLATSRRQATEELS